MEAPLNLNNQMVLMRKEIKRAKTWTLSKLVRHMKNLRNKKGNESQKNKNFNRANRLAEEIEIIKELKSDDIFKILLQSEHTTADLMDSNLALKQRAIIRIGAVIFIKKRMDEIKNGVKSFHLTRSNKNLPKTMKIPELDQENKEITGAVTKSMNKVTDESKSKDSIVNHNSEQDLSKDPCDDVVLEAPESASIKRREIVEDNIENDVENKICDDEIDSSDVDSLSANALIDDDSGYNANENVQNIEADPTDVDILKSSTEQQCEEVIIGTTQEGYQVVLPPYYAKQIREKESFQNNNMDISNFNIVAENKGAKEVTEILPNIGEGFSSPDENSDEDDIDYEDLVKSGLKSRQMKESPKQEEEEKIDLFFLDKKGSRDKSFLRIYKNIKSKENSEEETKSEMKSSFMGSLSKESSSSFKEKKNRPSQRARKKAHLKNDCAKDNSKSSIPHKDKLSKTENPRGRHGAAKNTSRVVKPKVSDIPLHPSWEASRKRKEQQSTIKPFEGKRVCFDDSD